MFIATLHQQKEISYAKKQNKLPLMKNVEFVKVRKKHHSIENKKIDITGKSTNL